MFYRKVFSNTGRDFDCTYNGVFIELPPEWDLVQYSPRI